MVAGETVPVLDHQGQASRSDQLYHYNQPYHVIHCNTYRLANSQIRSGHKYSVYIIVLNSIGVGSGGGGGARGRLAPPNFTHCLHNELHCSIVDCIACRHCSSRKSHFCCLKKMSPPKSEHLPTPVNSLAACQCRLL